MLKFSLLTSRTRLLLPAVSSRQTWFSSQVFCNVPPIKLKIQPAPPTKSCSYMDKNRSLKRPLSPHLSIYKVQMSSMMSISLRMTGLILGAMAWTVCLTKLATDLSVEDVVGFLETLELDDCYWTAAKTVSVFPFAFHLVAGIRHLLFDAAKLLERTHFFATGCTAIGVAFTLTLILGSMEDLREKYVKMLYRKQSSKDEN